MFNYMVVKSKAWGNSSRLAQTVIALFAVVILGATSRADDYILAAGDSATFDNGETNKYDTLYISGDLTVSGNTWLIGTSATNAVLSGGTVTVDGTKSVFGNVASGNSDGRDISLTPGADGKYTEITVRNGKNEAVSGRYYNVGAKSLNIEAETAESLAQYPDGVCHFLDIDGAGVNFHKLVNNSSLTGRVTIAGNSQFGTADGFYGEFFNKGNFIVEVAQGATHKFNAGNQLRTYNAAGCNVKETGGGNLEFYHVLNTQFALVKMTFDKGAVLDVTGTLAFDTLGWGGSVAWYAFNDSNVFGPNVGKIKSGSNANYSTVFDIPKGAEIAVHDFELKRAKDMVVGSGVVRVDASAESRKFEAVIPASYTFGTTTYDNKITVAKSGACDAEIVATNFPALRVDEGTVRLTTDCVVGSLQGAPGAKVVADGCTVTIADGMHTPNGLELATANGGRFVKAGSGASFMYGTAVLGTDLHVASGDVVFSAYGLTQKYWRWTFTKGATSPGPVWPGRVWMFDVDGGHAASGIEYATEANSTASLAANKACWEYSSATNIAKASSYNWQWEDRLKYVLGVDDLVKNMNNFFKCSSPEVDPENPDSWLGFGMRLADNAKPVTGYNIMAGDSAHYPVSWTVAVSDDGTTWTQIETRSDVVPAHRDYPYFYDGEKVADSAAPAVLRGKPVELFKFSGYKRNGLEADATKAVSLQVDDGASVDFTAFTEAPQKIGSITLDMAVGGGSIYGGSIAEGGTLYIVNAGDNLERNAPLSLELDGIADADNIKGWTVYINGVEKPNCPAKVIDGHLAIGGAGFMLKVR